MLTEWGVENGDDPSFVKRLFAWVSAIILAAGCSSTTRTSAAANAYRIQNYPASLAVLRRRLSSPSFPAYAFEPPQPPPPPPGGVSP